MGPQSADYEYDVFFSYKRNPQTNQWSRWVVEQLQYLLSQELNVERARIFVDVDDIVTGDLWREKIGLAIRRSKCLVCVWSPLYFQSKWCRSEFLSFLERQRLPDVRGLGGLIAPLQFHDGEHFPPEATQIQMTDVRGLHSAVPAFWHSQRALVLEDKIREFSKDVAEMIRRAPSYRDDWPIVEEEGLTPPTIQLAKL